MILWTTDMIALAMDLQARGWGKVRIAQRLGVHVRTYRYWLLRQAWGRP